MNRLKSYRKRDVVSVREGLVLGKPKELVVDLDAHRVGVVVLQEGATRETSVIIRAGDVHSFGADTIAIDSLESVDIAHRNSAALELMARAESLRRNVVVTSQGDRLGRIVEVQVDDSGVVTAYLVRRRFLGWFRRKLSLYPQQLLTGEDVFVAQEPTMDPPTSTSDHSRPEGDANGPDAGTRDRSA